jgi:hypothetical protein
MSKFQITRAAYERITGPDSIIQKYNNERVFKQYIGQMLDLFSHFSGLTFDNWRTQIVSQAIDIYLLIDIQLTLDGLLMPEFTDDEVNSFLKIIKEEDEEGIGLENLLIRYGIKIQNEIKDSDSNLSQFMQRSSRRHCELLGGGVNLFGYIAYGYLLDHFENKPYTQVKNAPVIGQGVIYGGWGPN